MKSMLQNLTIIAIGIGTTVPRLSPHLPQTQAWQYSSGDLEVVVVVLDVSATTATTTANYDDVYDFDCYGLAAVVVGAAAVKAEAGSLV